MNTQHLRHFLIAARFLNMRKASEQLNISQPGLSRSISALETYLGLPLFSRNGRRLELTKYGATLVPRAEILVNQRDATIRELRELYSTGLGRIRLSANTVFSHFFLPEIISDALVNSLASRIDVFTESYDESIRRLRSGDIDFILTVAFPRQTMRSPELIYTPMYSVDVSIFTSNTDLPPDTELSDVELANSEWCSLEFETVDGFTDYFRSRDLDPPHISVNCNSIQFMLNVLHSGVFLTILPDAIVKSSKDYSAKLRRIQSGVPLSGGHGGVIYRRDGILSEAAHELIQRIAERASRVFVSGGSKAPHSQPIES
jgi:DNA-binding transcriptional LysR family regulator